GRRRRPDLRSAPRRPAKRLRKLIAGLAVVALIAGLACAVARVAQNKADHLTIVAEGEATKAQKSERDTAEAQALVKSQKREVVASLAKAEAAGNEARAAEEQGRRLLYTTDMQLVPFIWKDPMATVAQLRSRLNAHDPAQNQSLVGREDLRGFEWRYYQHLLESNSAVFSGHGVSVVDGAFTSNGKLVTL